MITALISSLVGMLSGVLPDLLKIWTNASASKNERALIELQAKMQIELAKVAQTTKLGEISGNEAIAHVKAGTEQLLAAIEANARLTGIAWVDALNAAMRPVCTYVLIGLFTVVTCAYSGGVLWDFMSNSIDAQTAGKMLYGGLVGEFYMAVFAFTFGYRSAVKK